MFVLAVGAREDMISVQPQVDIKLNVSLAVVAMKLLPFYRFAHTHPHTATTPMTSSSHRNRDAGMANSRPRMRFMGLSSTTLCSPYTSRRNPSRVVRSRFGCNTHTHCA